MIRELHRDEYIRVEHEPSMDVVRVARTDKRFADLAETQRVYGELERALSTASGKLLLDLREDGYFEVLLKVVRPQLLARFARVAVLVKTNAAVQRVGIAPAFADEDKAFDHLLG